MATGQGIAQWQDDTPPPRLPLSQTQPFLIQASKEWLTPRIESRFAKMIASGALEEARANYATWSPELPSAKAIGAAELIHVIDGQLTIDEARERATILTRQFAKRQRTWFRARMQAWTPIDAPTLNQA